MKKIFLVISYLLIFTSCTRNIDQQKFIKERLKEVNIEYQQDMKEIKIPLALLDHFPSSIKHLPTSQAESFATSNNRISYMLFEYGLPQTTIDSTKKIYSETAIQVSTGNDSSLIIVKSKLQIELYGKPSPHNDKTIKLYPIPFFESKEFNNPEDVVTTEDMYSNTNISGLSDNFSIYVLDSKPGNYCEGLKPLDYMPEGWKNGYSKGLCINKKIGVIIYWVIIW